MMDHEFEEELDLNPSVTATSAQSGGASPDSPSEPPLSRADLEAFAHQVASWLPHQGGDGGEDPYARQIEDRVTRQVQQLLHQTLGPIQHRQALEQLAMGHDPAALRDYTEGLTPQELQFMASHPGLSRMAQDALRGRTSTPAVQSTRSSEGFDGDEPLAGGAEDERAKWRGLASVFGGDAVQKLISQRRAR